MVPSVGAQRWRELIAAERFADALQLATQRVVVTPREADEHCAVGYSLMRLGRPGPAEMAFRASLRLEPGHVLARAMLARTLVEQGRTREALTEATSVSNAVSLEAEVWDALGVVFGHAGEFERAVEAFTLTVQLRPECARSWFNLGSMQNFYHRIGDAEAAYLKVLELDPDHYLSYWSIAQLRTQTLQRNHVEWYVERLATCSDLRGQIYLAMALAKEYEDLGNVERSFHYLKRGIAIKRRSIDYHASVDVERFAQIKAAFPRGASAMAARGFDSGEPIFVVGMPRTGTTLLEQMLSTHEQIYAAGELQNFQIEWARCLSPIGRTPTSTEMLRSVDALNYRELGQRYVESTRPRTGSHPHFIDKLPNNFLHLGAICRALPNARVLHMTRDPMDTCFANLKQLYAHDAYPYTYDQTEVAEYYLLYLDLMRHWHALLPGRILDVAYEELVTDTERAGRRIFSFLEIRWSTKVLGFAERPQAVGTASAAQVRRPIYQTSVGRWRQFEQYLQPMAAVLRGADAKK